MVQVLPFKGSSVGTTEPRVSTNKCTPNSNAEEDGDSKEEPLLIYSKSRRALGVPGTCAGRLLLRRAPESQKQTSLSRNQNEWKAVSIGLNLGAPGTP